MSMTVIEHIEVGSGGAASIDFVSVGDIPSEYTDLVLKLSLRSAGGAYTNGLRLEFNNNTSSIYSVRNLQAIYSSGPNSNTNPYNVTNAMVVSFMPSPSQTASTFANTEITIPNYRSSSAKSVSINGVSENNSAFLTSEVVALNIAAGLFNSTDPITSIKLTTQEGNNFAEYSSATLYGIRKYDTAGSPKATGGIISFDSANNKWVHTFTASGTFTPTEDLTCEYLVVAGGGGGSKQGGGGGAGGYRSSVSGESSGGGASAETPLSLTASTGYTVTVGAGGSQGTPANAGSNSVFSTITSTGGGYGGAANTAYTSGGTGGSGGGGWGSSGSGGSNTSDQGYSGGSGDGTDPASAGGGGGASAAGANATSSTGGNGGAGLTSSITGFAIARAGGGGGGAVSTRTAGTASDGGGDGTNSNTGAAESGLVNTGGGGGGSGYAQGQSNTSTGGNGGSGIVIVRYSA